MIKKVCNINPSGKGMNGNVFDADYLCPTLTTNKGEGLKILIKNATKSGYLIASDGDEIDILYSQRKTRRGRVQKEMSHTITTDSSKAVIVQKPRGFNKGGVHENSPSITKSNWQENNFLKNDPQDYQIRKLTPRECWRLMGISDKDFEKAQSVNSNSQLYKQAGNAIVVDVLEAIFGRLYETDK